MQTRYIPYNDRKPNRISSITMGNQIGHLKNTENLTNFWDPQMAGKKTQMDDKNIFRKLVLVLIFNHRIQSIWQIFSSVDTM